MLNYKEFPVMETKNLILRRMDHNDIDDLFEMRKDVKMHEYTDSKPDESMDETRAYLDKMNKGIDDRKWIIWAIEYKEDKKLIGTVSIWNINNEQKSAELGYGIVPDYQGRGLMREALMSAAEYGFRDMNLKTIEAVTEENNHKSLKLLAGCGFIETGRVDDEGYVNDRIYHMVVYSLENNNNH